MEKTTNTRTWFGTGQLVAVINGKNGRVRHDGRFCLTRTRQPFSKAGVLETWRVTLLKANGTTLNPFRRPDRIEQVLWGLDRARLTEDRVTTRYVFVALAGLSQDGIGGLLIDSSEKFLDELPTPPVMSAGINCL